jgi:hypothetical protein
VASTPVGDVALTYRFSEKTVATVSYSRRNLPAIDSSSTYTADAINARVTQQLGSRGKWRVSLGGGYTFYSFGDYRYAEVVIPSDREDQNVALNAELTYLLQRWCTVSLRYDYENLVSSSESIIDYDVNRVTLRFAVGY